MEQFGGHKWGSLGGRQGWSARKRSTLPVGHGRSDLIEISQRTGAQRVFTGKKRELLGVLAAHALVQDDAAVLIQG